MAGIKSLVKDTAVYGLSSIIGRFLNWCLVPLYVYIFPASQYGIVSYLYGFTAVVLVILNYGMETGFFRFANKEQYSEKVYTTSLLSVGATSLLFIVLVSLFLHPISRVLLLPDNSTYIWLLGVTVAMDAFSNIPFAYLRFKKKAWRFAGIKLLNVGINIGLNIFFILCCPYFWRHCPQTIGWFYEPLGGVEFGIGWIFVANIISSAVILLMLLPELTGRKYSFSRHLLMQMLGYSWPLLILGVAGILSQNMGQIIIPYLFEGHEHEARTMVGIYGANIKIAIVMVMFTQAFRYAYEPFIFAHAKESGEDKKSAYCDAMKYFIIFGLLIFLGVMYYLPVLRHFISPSYWSGLKVIPVMMLAELCFGIFFNLSLWYKLTDRTQWGMYFSLICFVVMLVLNIWWVKMIGIPNGYMGSAWAALVSYFLVMVLSWAVGRKFYPLPYPMKRIGMYILVATALYAGGELTAMIPSVGAMYLIRTLLLVVYCGIVATLEEIPVLSPLLRRFLKR